MRDLKLRVVSVAAAGDTRPPPGGGAPVSCRVPNPAGRNRVGVRSNGQAPPREPVVTDWWKCLELGRPSPCSSEALRSEAPAIAPWSMGKRRDVPST
jgi:hypothetical protein